jgi:uncharacterized protein (TIGR03067 family)
MDKKLPARPDLDHLRRQAKSLLADLIAGDQDAVATFQQHLPAAKKMSAREIRSAGFRLADAQSAVARKSGFASWPQLGRHVEQLRALEGTWSLARLEVDGQTMPAAALAASCILIDGDRFRTESPAAIYEGIFNINVELQPHEIDIEFVAGPEAGNWNYGIFRLDGDGLEICLDLNGRRRPNEFRAARGSGHAYESLRRTSEARPADVAGGTAPKKRAANSLAEECVGFEFVGSPSLLRLQGEWVPVKIVLDGNELPKIMLKMGHRMATKNEVKIIFAGQTTIHALVRLDESKDPIHMDYYNLHGTAKGTIQNGIMKWIGDEACFCMAAPGNPRPTDFTSALGSGRTLSHWRKSS